MSVVPCPAGFDCIFANSCPSQVIDCPPGYFCSSYRDHDHEKLIDFRFAEYQQRFTSNSVSESNYMSYIDSKRFVQTECIAGFYCPNSTTISSCPEGHWCSEKTRIPRKCDTISTCSHLSIWEVDFVDAIIALILSFLMLTTSITLIRVQKLRQVKSQINQPQMKEPVTDSNVRIEIPGVELQFVDIEFEYDGTIILPKISGRIPSNSMSCLLGPSACGKSSLLHVLRNGGKGARGGVVGLARISGRKDASHVTVAEDEAVETIHMDLTRGLIGFVPQEDILDRQFTVRELLDFNAKLRLPALYTNPVASNQVVEEVLDSLLISKIADTVIGGSANAAANISGGQLKRVNIAVELVSLTRPGVLLLDEPTAGLDAAVSLDLVQNLKRISRQGTTILMVLQQPRPEIFKLLDHLFLMRKDGKLVFDGDPAGAAPHLASLGFRQPEETSDADFCIDVLNDIASLTAAGVGDGVAVSDTDLAAAWDRSVKAGLQQRAFDRSASAGATQPLAPTQGPLATLAPLAAAAAIAVLCHLLATAAVPLSAGPDGQTFRRVLLLEAQRLMLHRLRDCSALLTYFFLHVIMAAALSSGFSILIQGTYLFVLTPPVQPELAGYFPTMLTDRATHNVTDMGFQQLLFFMSGALGCASALAAVPVFSGFIAIRKREAQAGISPVASAIGRLLGDLIFVAWNAMVFCGVWTLFGHAGFWYHWIVTVCCTAFASSGLGYVAGAVSSPATASTYAIIANFVLCVFSGVEPRLAQVMKFPVINWLWMVSYATWTAEATYFTWTRYLEHQGDPTGLIQQGADVFGYRVDSLSRSAGAMLALGVALRIIAVAVIYWQCRHK